MWEISLFLLLFVAVAVGWCLGRSTLNTKGSEHSAVPPTYYQGINYLINDGSDLAIQAFIQSLPVNSETFELHIALGNLLRKKGEVESAIRIHQNLLARPSLSKEYVNSAHLELARDYISAGLLDRAERLLSELVSESVELRECCLKLMLEIYQNEKEWDKAIETANALRPKRRLKRDQIALTELAQSVSHFFCEQAETALNEHNYQAAREKIRMAFRSDRNCVRGGMLSAQLDLILQQPKQAIKTLTKVKDQDMDFLPEAIPLLEQAYDAVGKRPQLLQFIQECLQCRSSTKLLLAATEEMESQQGKEAALHYLSTELKKRPTLRGLSRLVDYHMPSAEGAVRENYTVLQTIIQDMMAQKPLYQCQSCGFSGMQLHWLCPSCKSWGQIKLIEGVEGD